MKPRGPVVSHTLSVAGTRVVVAGPSDGALGAGSRSRVSAGDPSVQRLVIEFAKGPRAARERKCTAGVRHGRPSIQQK